MKRFAPLTLAATTALVLAGCTSDADAYDEPSELRIAMATDAYNEAVEEYWGPNFTMEEFEIEAKNACDRLPEKPTYDDYTELIEQIEEEQHNMQYNVAVTLVTHGTGAFCRSKLEHAHND